MVKNLKASKGIVWMVAKEVTSIYNRFILKNLYGKLQTLNRALYFESEPEYVVKFYLIQLS
jgi:hypothetical protein